jgi:hypothetical protein
LFLLLLSINMLLSQDFQGAVEESTLVLELDSANLKALFCRAKSYFELQSFDAS